MNALTEFPSLAEFAPDPFADTLQRLRGLYDAMATALGVDRQLMEEQRDRARGESPESYAEWEHLIYQNWEDDLDESKKLLCEMVLVRLNTAARSLLNETGARPDRHEKKPRGAWPDYFKAAFSKRKIDLTSAPGWDCVQEIAAARDKTQHPEAPAVRGNRYIDAVGEVEFSREVFEATLARLGDFAKWLREQ